MANKRIRIYFDIEIESTSTETEDAVVDMINKHLHYELDLKGAGRPSKDPLSPIIHYWVAKKMSLPLQGEIITLQLLRQEKIE